MASPPTESRTKKQLLVAAAGVTAVSAVVAVWFGVHHVPWLGPRLHDIGVSILGKSAMGWIEGIAYAADAGWNKLWGIDERPEAIWDVPASSASASASGVAPLSPWIPHSPGPMVHAPFAKDDGIWFPIVDAASQPLVFRMPLHPDGDRQDAVIKIAAVDLRRVEVQAAPGSTLAKDGGAVPSEALSRLIAIVPAGRRGGPGFGLAVGGRVLVASRPTGCVVRRTGEPKLYIGYDRAGSASPARGEWWVQTPPCGLESGEIQPGVRESSEDGTRQAWLGIARDGTELFVGVGENTSEAAWARAMKHAGAWNAAKLPPADGQAALYYAAVAGGAVDRSMFDDVSRPDAVRQPLAGAFIYLAGTTK